MIHKGFEYAFLFGEPQNGPGKRYRVQPPCCSIILSTTKGRGDGYTCGHPWEATWKLPVGDPTTGGPWRKVKPDTGSYVGGDLQGVELPLGVERPIEANSSAITAER